MPPVLIEMAIASFRAPRAIQIREGIAEDAFPSQGIMAGHTFAKALLAAYYVDAIDAWKLRNPGVDIDIYIDDLFFSVFADTHEEVVETLTRAGLDLHEVIRNELF